MNADWKAAISPVEAIIGEHGLPKVVRGQVIVGDVARVPSDAVRLLHRQPFLVARPAAAERVARPGQVHYHRVQVEALHAQCSVVVHPVLFWQKIIGLWVTQKTS